MQTAQTPPADLSCPVRPIEPLILLAIGLLSALWCVTAARELGATFDEPIYLKEGLTRWHTGSTAGMMKLGTMPLPVDVQTLPLYLWERATGHTIDPEADLHLVLPWARACTLLFWWMLLLHVWLAGRALGGPWAGLIAAAFVAFEPSLVAHAGLATTDIAVTACLVALAYHFSRSRTGGWRRRIAWPALWFALAVLAKASGLVFGALSLVVIEGMRCAWWRGKNPAATRFRDSFRDLVKIGSLGMVLVFLYCGSDCQPQRSFLAWAQGLPEGSSATLMVWIAEHLRIFSNAGEGILKQVTHNVRGHGSYLLGEVHPRALWYYFPVILTIKVTIPLLAGFLLVTGLRMKERSFRGNWPLLCALALLGFSVVCRVQIGIRFMFPLIVFAVIGLAVIVVQTMQNAPLARRRVLAGAIAGCLAWTMMSTATVWPHGLCYVNPLWGGTEDGYKLVSEANYDWGQGLKELARWQENNHVAPLDVWTYTTDSMLARMPARTVQPLTLPVVDEASFVGYFRGHYLAVSTTSLRGALSYPAFEVMRRTLEKRRPVARTSTFLIYDFTHEEEPGLTHAAMKNHPAP